MMYKFILVLCFLCMGCPGVVVVSACGNGVLEAGEGCDDTNLTNADGCEADCSLPACNNGIVDPGEVCFFDPLLFDTDLFPNDLVEADFNGDGALDLAASTSGNSVHVFLGDGLGSFSLLPDLVLDAAGGSLVVGDFDGDSILDLATDVGGVFEEVKVFRGLGDGSFAPLATLPGDNPDDLVIGDFNENGALDLAFASGDGIDVFLGNGAGLFFPPLSFSGGATLSNLASGDFNGDGRLDIVAIQQDNLDAFLLFLGDGLGNFAAQTPKPTASSPINLFAADLNDDTIFDVAIIRLGKNDILLFTGNGDGLFLEPDTISVFKPSSLAPGDINGDGLLDLAVSSTVDQNQNANLAILLGEGAGVFSSEPLLFPLGAVGPEELVIADLNEDGAQDVALIEQNDRLVVFLSQP